MPASEFSKDRCKVVHLCWGNPKHKHRLDGEHIESRPEDLRVLVDKKLSVTEQCGLAAQKPQPYPGLHQKKQEQQVEGFVSPPPLLCPISGSAGDQVRWSFEQPGLVEGVAPHGQVTGTR